MSQYKHWHMKASPDVLLLPSKLTLSPKEIQGTLVLNPGTLAKGANGGTFAEIFIHPMKESDLKASDESVLLQHKVAERSVVNIIKI